jgi:hypothetical protein
MNTSTYEKKKEKIELEFFSSLACHNTAFYLAEKIPDPVNPAEKIYRLYANCRSPKAPHKKKILNWALCIFSTTLVKKEYRKKDLSDPIVFAQAQYQPNVIDTTMKTLFAKFSSVDINYSLNHDFNGTGKCCRMCCQRTMLSIY